MKVIKRVFKGIFNHFNVIFSNIKYMLTNDLRKLDIYSTNHIESIENEMFEMGDIIKSNTNDIEDKCDDYQVEDIISNMIGCVDDLATYDDINDIKDDLKKVGELLEVLRNNNDLLMAKYNDTNDVGGWAKGDKIDYISNDSIERDLLINEVIKSIINRLEIQGDCSIVNDNV